MLSRLQRTLAKKNICTEILTTLQQRAPSQQQNRTFAIRATRRKRPPPSRLTASAHDGSSTLVSSASNTNNDANANKPSAQVRELIDSSTTFVARDKDGNELPMDEYLKFASLSPWVPCPDPVARKLLDISQIGPDDVHYELGSGDGRINFHAIDPPYAVKKSVGIDIDPSLIQTSNDRMAKRHPRPQNMEFICADLLDATNDTTKQIWASIKDECTVLTMYFVEDALLKIKPALERHLGGSPCKIVTVGYEMHGWVPDWEEVILGLKIHLYDMKDFKERPLPLEELPTEFSGAVLGGDRSEAMPEDENSPFNKSDSTAQEPEPDPTADIPFGWDDFDEVVDFVEEEREADSTDGQTETPADKMMKGIEDDSKGS